MSRIPFTARVAVPEGVLVRDLDGEAVALDLKTEKYYGLDQSGTRFWVALNEAASIQAAFELLLAEYDVEAERLRGDLEQFISKLVEHGLLVIRE